MAVCLALKGKNFGEGKPIICVPVTEHRKTDIINEIKRLVELDVEMIEWRIDAYEEVENVHAVKALLEEIRPFVVHTVFLYTFRSKKQGGLKEIEADKLEQLHQIAAESKVVDFIDIEYFETSNCDKKIIALQELGTHVIVSHHDFDKTPSATAITKLLEEMAQSKADIVKLAVMPHDNDDVLRLLEETYHFHKRYPNRLLITMSMGSLGKVSRMMGELFGSCVTFGAGQNESAPGQIRFERLNEILTVING